MPAQLIDRNFSRANVIRGFHALRRYDPGNGARLVVGDYASDFSVRDHYHPDIMIDVILAGRGVYRERGREISCESGTVFMVRPGHVHDTRPSPSGMMIMSISATDTWLADAGLSTTLMANTSRSPLLALTANRLMMELNLGDFASALTIEELMSQALLLAVGREESNVAAHEPPRWARNVAERLRSDPTTPVSLRSLAQEAGVHFTHLARVFRLHFGCTIGEFQRMARVQHSVKHLVESREPIASIALRTGFCDQSHYTRCFCRLMRISPGSFRRLAARREVRAAIQVRR